jgi:MFS family permease
MSMLRTSDPYRRTQTAIAALFFLLGFQYATWASRLPAIAARLHLTSMGIGILLLACGAGAAGSFPLVSFLMRRLGSRRVCCISALFLGLCLLLLIVAPSYPVVLVVICCDGVACACLDVSMNAQGAALEARYQRSTMARLHATFSAGALCAALLASGVSKLTPALWVHFSLVTVIVVLLVAYSGPRLLTQDLEPSKLESPKKERRRLALPSRTTALLGIALAFATVTEGAMNDWSALYLKDVAKSTATVTPMGIATFSIAMVLARALADGPRARWGDRRLVLAGGALAAAGLTQGLLLGGVAPALLGFACVGLGIGAVAPCIYVAAAEQGPHALTLVAAMGVTGMLAGPPVIGSIASASSLAWGMGAVALSALLVTGCATQIRWPVPSRNSPPDGKDLKEDITIRGTREAREELTALPGKALRSRGTPDVQLRNSAVEQDGWKAPPPASGAVLRRPSAASYRRGDWLKTGLRHS